MPQKKIDIELRIQKTGSVFSWEVYLENTNSSSRVANGWDYDPVKGYYYVTLDKYPISDGALDVFLGCEGKQGGKTSCAVFINSKEQTSKVKCNNTDPNYGHGAYQL